MSATSLVFYSRLSLPPTLLLTTNSHLLYVFRHVESIENSHVNHHNQSISHHSKKILQLMWYILLSATSLVFSSRLSVPSTLLLTTNCYLPYVVRHVESIETLMFNHHNHCISHPSKKILQLMWYILLSATSLVFSSTMSLLSTVLLTTKPHEQKVGKWGIQKKDT